PQHGAEADGVEKVRVAEGDVERNDQRDPVGRALDRDPLGAESIELGARVCPRGYGDVELAVDHAVRAISDDRELVREARVHAGVVAAVRVEPYADRRKELRVRDVLELGSDHAARDLELLLVREPGGKKRDDAVVLAG